MRAVAAVLGVLSTLWVLKAMVQDMLVPRGTRALLARTLSASVNGVSRAPLSVLRTYGAQDRWIAGAAPASVLLQLVVYFTLVILTMGLVMYGVTDLSLGQSMYQSGASVTTLGMVEPVDDAGEVASFVAAFLGLVVVAVFIGNLMALYGAYVARESQMARLALLAGQPPWGPEIVARAYALRITGPEILEYGTWIDWICEVRMNHNVNPVVAHFRATDPSRHWTVAILAVTDAVGLRLTSGEVAPHPLEVRLFLESILALRILSQGYEDNARNEGLERQILAALDGGPGRPGDAGLGDVDWQEGLDAMGDVGVPLPADTDAWRERFFALRGFYAQYAYRLAEKYHAVPAPWSGPRRPPLPTVWPGLLSERS